MRTFIRGADRGGATTPQTRVRDDRSKTQEVLGSIIPGLMLKAPKAAHLLATMRVLRFRYARPSLSIQDAHNAVQELAVRLDTGEPPRDDDLVLEETLRKATGVSVAELAHVAEDWPA